MWVADGADGGSDAGLLNDEGGGLGLPDAVPVSDDDAYCVSLGEAPLLPVGTAAAVCVAVAGPEPDGKPACVCVSVPEEDAGTAGVTLQVPLAEGVSVAAKLPVGLVVIEAVSEGVERPLGDCERVGDAD